MKLYILFVVKWYNGNIHNPSALYHYNGILAMIETQMARKKTSLNMDDKLWQEWLIYVVKKTGSSRKVSDSTAEALTEYMKNHPI